MFYKFLLLSLTLTTYYLYVTCLICYQCTNCKMAQNASECPENATSCFSVGFKGPTVPGQVNYVRGCGYIPEGLDDDRTDAYGILLCLTLWNVSSVTHCSAQYCYESICNTNNNIQPEVLPGWHEERQKELSNSVPPNLVINFYIFISTEIFLFIVK